MSGEGQRGVQGRRGEQGTQGVSGEQGVAGEQGVSGETGQTGAKGEQGSGTGLPKRVELSFWLVVLVATAVVAGLSFVIVDNRHLAHEGAQAHDALCVLKVDLDQRVDQTAAFLESHPQGFAGVDAATIQNSIRNQRATIESLRLLDCIPPPDPKETG